MTPLASTPEQVLAAAGAENFPVALRVLPRWLRGELAAVYAYARLVDDIGDGRLVADPLGRAALLDVLDDDLDAVWSGRATLPVLQALQPVVTRAGLDPAPFRDLIAAQRLDLEVSDYPDWDALRAGCRLSADPVGRIVLGLVGATGDVTEPLSDDICTALQLLEHLQDVAEDHAAGRVYLPADSLVAAGISRAELGGPVTSPALRGVVLGQVERARRLLASAAELLPLLPPAGRLAVSGFAAGGFATADALVAADGDVLARTVQPATPRVFAHAARLMAAATLRRARTGAVE